VSSELARTTVGFAVWKLNQSACQVRECVQLLSEEQLWKRFGQGQNSVANLLLHMAGNVRQRVQHGLARQPDVRDRNSEFAATGGFDRFTLMKILDETLAEATDILCNLDEPELVSPSVLRPDEFTKLEAILQVLSHFSQHSGQIIFATKVMVGPELGLPPASGPVRTP
jgi:hypothetical protein